MRIESNRIVIRDFERKDSENLYRIVREKDILRFMPQSYFPYIDWRQT